MGDFKVGVKLKKMWKSAKSKKSLREFVRELAASGNDLASQWFENKDGALNEVRKDTNLARAKLERDATKSARRKSSAGKS